MTVHFDTRDTKPKLRALALLTAAAAIVVAALQLSGADPSALFSCAVMSVYALGAAVVLLWAFREQLRYNPYSYNTIFYFGFTLFSLFVATSYIVLTVRILRHPELYSTTGVIYTLLASAKVYMLLTGPFLVVFCTALCISNIALIRHEGRHPVNLLGIVLSVLILAGAFFLYRFDYAFSGSLWEVIVHDLFANLFAAIYLYFECMLIGTVVADAIVARHEPEKDKAYLIILGCGLKADGTPTPLLQGRIERALGFYEKQLARTGKPLTFIASGGQGPDEAIPESRAIKRYLTERGIPEEQIIEEDRSTNTFENMRLSKELIEKRGTEGKIAFSTTNYHVFRSGLFARRVKMRAVGMGARTKWYFWPNAAVREFVGLLTKHRGKQALILGSMAVLYAALTFVYYLYDV